MLNGKSILITGGTGSFGKRFVQTIVTQYPEITRLVIYSRDELKQYEMAQQFSIESYPQLRYFIGDVRDRDRLTRAMEGIDVVIHAAALKQEVVQGQAQLESQTAQVTELTAENEKYRNRHDQFKYSLPLLWVASAMAVCLLCGFLGGLWWIDRKSRSRHGGFRVY